MLVVIDLAATVQGRPLGLLLEETHSLDVLPRVNVLAT